MWLKARLVQVQICEVQGHHIYIYIYVVLNVDNC